MSERAQAIMSERGQAILVWWGLIMMYIYGFTLWLGFDMVGPPTPMLTDEEVRAFYLEDNLAKRLAAMITSWVSAFAVPIQVVAAIQVARLEKQSGSHTPVWGFTTFASGILMTIFLVLPPLFWGVAAYTAGRPSEVTTLMHELGMLTLTTTDQFYIFGMVAIAYVSLCIKNHDALSPFPRWMGYFTLWAALAFEVGAFAFIPKSGPFAWSGIVVFWMPFVVYGAWITVLCVMLLKVVKRQAAAKDPIGAG